MAPEVLVKTNNGATSDDEARAMTMPGCQRIDRCILMDKKTYVHRRGHMQTCRYVHSYTMCTFHSIMYHEQFSDKLLAKLTAILDFENFIEE